MMISKNENYNERFWRRSRDWRNRELEELRIPPLGCFFLGDSADLLPQP